jgi:hypothetical protein
MKWRSSLEKTPETKHVYLQQVSPRSPDFLYSFRNIRSLHTGFLRLSSGLGNQFIEIIHGWRGNCLEDNGVFLSDNNELRTGIQAEAFANLLGNDNLSLGRHFRGGQSCHFVSPVLDFLLVRIYKYLSPMAIRKSKKRKLSPLFFWEEMLPYMEFMLYIRLSLKVAVGDNG